MGDLAQSLRRHAGLETLRKLRLQSQGGDETDKIGVAAALAKTIQRALHLPHAGADGGERIGDRVAGVVVGMDAETCARNDARDLADDAFDLIGQRSAVGVAEHRPARAGVDRGARAGERIFRIGLVAVEEMLAIDHRLAARADRRLHAVGDGLEVLVERAAQRDMDVIVPRLGDIDDRVGVGGEKTSKAWIIGGRAAGPLGHAEGAEAGAVGGLLFEEFGVERIRARIAALDIVDAEPVEHRRDAALVVEREVDAGGERAVAHRRVEQIEAFFGHRDHCSSGRRGAASLMLRSKAIARRETGVLPNALWPASRSWPGRRSCALERPSRRAACGAAPQDEVMFFFHRVLSAGSGARTRRQAFWSSWCWRATRRRRARDCASAQ